jgi:hypothetical protein
VRRKSAAGRKVTKVMVQNCLIKLQRQKNRT